MTSIWERILTGVLAAAAVAVAVSVVHTSFFATSPGNRPEGGPPEYVEDWEEALSFGIPVAGESAAPVTIMALVDLECPACAGFHRGVLSELIAERSDQVRLVYVHYPLDYHLMAIPAARAAECAREVGAFKEWADVIYTKQDSLGVKSWGSYAFEAGIMDTTRIQACATAPGRPFGVDAGRAFGSKIGVDGIPTILVNGWRFPDPPPRERLAAAIDALLNGDEPE